MNNKISVLVVDDSQFDRGLLLKALARRPDFEVFEAATGHEALEFLKANSVNVVLLDVQLPDLSGRDVLRAIRTVHRAVELPVIMVTGETEIERMVECLQLGANDYITKPVIFDAVIARVRLQFDLQRMVQRQAEVEHLAAVAATIATISHEINNPLAIALGYLQVPDAELLSRRETVKTALERIKVIVKEMTKLRDAEAVEFAKYADSVQMLKLK